MSRSFESVPLRSFAEFQEYQPRANVALQRQFEIERGLIPDADEFVVEGFCAVCDAPARFHVDFLYGGNPGSGQPVSPWWVKAGRKLGIVPPAACAPDRRPNWRERLVCRCGLNNRLRGALHFLADRMGENASPAIYATEQVTPLYAQLLQRYSNVTGSEYLRDGTLPGQVNDKGIRHEDVTSLSFADNSFDCILSFDVLEHVPDYRAALRECLRCLKPGGHFILSVPFVNEAEKTIVRATVAADGAVEMLLPPEYHGDPVDNKGILCFYHFGWDLLDDMRSIGFSDAVLHFYWSKELGYLGEFQSLIYARK